MLAMAVASSSLRTRSLLLYVFVVVWKFCAAQVPREYAQNLTVYHLNPASAGAVPINMDTGDVRGDLFFYLGEFLLPLECQNASGPKRAEFDCNNPERVDPNLLVTRVQLEIDSRTTAYSACNLCENGTVPFSHQRCETGKYFCFCHSHHTGAQEICDPTKVGLANVTERFAAMTPTAECAAMMDTTCGKVRDSKLCPYCLLINHQKLARATCTGRALFGFCSRSPFHECGPDGPDWGCWAENIPRKTGGFWYSLLKAGMCGPDSAAGTCGWKVQETRSVHKECLNDRLVTVVESQQLSCFQACGPRNTTSPCWISCFFHTLLGDDAGKSSAKPLGGMNLEIIEQAWEGIFAPVEDGGCPQVYLVDTVLFGGLAPSVVV